MRVGFKIALVGGVPILAAGTIAAAGWLLLAQAERARGGAVLAADVYHDLATARLVRDQYAAAGPSERAAFAARFATLTAGAEAGLDALSRFTRTADQGARIASVRAALGRYRGEMDGFVRLTDANDGLTREMARRADTLIDLTDRARLRQQASNADLARSLGEKVEALRAGREIVSGIHAVRARAAEGALLAARAAPDDPATQRVRAQVREAGRTLAAALRESGRGAQADEFDALAGAADGGAGDRDGRLDAWIARSLKIETSGQRTRDEEVAQLLAYAVEANEVEQATQNIAVGTLKLGPRTAGALVRRDAARAEEMLAEGERLGRSTAALPISPLIQAEMVRAIGEWRERLATTIVGLRRQIELIGAMDRLADLMGESARALNDAFVGDAERFGTFIQRMLLVGAAGLLLVGTLVVLFVARSILVPLRALQGDMIVLAGDPTGSAVRGTGRRDELGDIARATAVFVSEIGRREGALRRAKDRADAALAELRRTQDELVRAEKLASLGQLVAGVAHEINTPLGIALTTGTLVGDEARTFRAAIAAGTLSRTRLNRFVDRVEEGAGLLRVNLTRAADLVHGFKQVAVDRVSDESRSFPLDAWLDDLLASLRPMLRKGSHTVARACPPGLVVDTNPGVLAQVVTNLVANAAVHGFRDGGPGHILVRVEADPDEIVRIEVRDDGRGIPAADLDRIFDPFFTTARSSGSTGLGLHIVHNLVTAKLGGRIEVESVPGEGTVARIAFPARAAAGGAVSPAATQASAQASAQAATHQAAVPAVPPAVAQVVAQVVE